MDKEIFFVLGLVVSVLLGYIIYLRIRYRELREQHLRHRFHHRFKILPTKNLEGFLGIKKIDNKEDEILYEEIEKIVEGRNNRRKK